MHIIKYLWPILLSTTLQINAQAQVDLSDNLSKAERMKKIMYENYEASHSLAKEHTQDSLVIHGINGQQIVRDKDEKIIKQGEFRNGMLREWLWYKYNGSGKLLETHQYKNGKYVNKIMP